MDLKLRKQPWKHCICRISEKSILIRCQKVKHLHQWSLQNFWIITLRWHFLHQVQSKTQYSGRSGRLGRYSLIQSFNFRGDRTHGPKPYQYLQLYWLHVPLKINFTFMLFGRFWLQNDWMGHVIKEPCERSWHERTLLKVPDPSAKHVAIYPSYLFLSEFSPNFNRVRTYTLRKLERAEKAEVHNVRKSDKNSPNKNILVSKSNFNVMP